MAPRIEIHRRGWWEPLRKARYKVALLSIRPAIGWVPSIGGFEEILWKEF